MPSLPNYNRFDVLTIHESNEIVETVAEAVQNPDTLSDPFPTTTYFQDTRPKWERRLLSRFVVAATEESPTSLKLKVEYRYSRGQVSQLPCRLRSNRRAH